MLGSFAVGKTSLVHQFVKSIFSEKYLSTVGVKIDKKSIVCNQKDVDLILWDIHGEDDFQSVRMSYLKGAFGYLLVVDGTRKNTLDTALMLHQKVLDTIGKIPFVMLINKFDLIYEWEIDEHTIDQLKKEGFSILNTSAKTNTGVEEAFLELTNQMLGNN